MLTQDQLSFYDEHGYLVIQGVFTSDEIARLSEITNDLAAEAKKFELNQKDNQFENLRGSQLVLAASPQGETAIKRLVWAGAAAPELVNMGRDHRLLNFVSEVLETDEADHLINQVHFKHPNDGVSFGWHQDEQNRRAFDPQWEDCGKRGSFIQVITAIDENTQKNGPLMVIPGSHRWGFLKFSAFLNTSQLQEGFLRERGLVIERVQVALVMKPGDVVLMHPNLIHGSEPNKSNQARRILLNGFSSPNANHRPYPGEGSAKRVDLKTGKEIDLRQRVSVSAMLAMRQQAGSAATRAASPSRIAMPLIPTFH